MQKKSIEFPIKKYILCNLERNKFSENIINYFPKGLGKASVEMNSNKKSCGITRPKSVIFDLYYYMSSQWKND